MRWLWLGAAAVLPLLVAACDYGMTADEVAAEEAARLANRIGRVAPAGPLATDEPGTSSVSTAAVDEPKALAPSTPLFERPVPGAFPGIGQGFPEPPGP